MEPFVEGDIDNLFKCVAWESAHYKAVEPVISKTKLVATLKKFYGRHHDLVIPYNVAVFRIVSDVFANR